MLILTLLLVFSVGVLLLDLRLRWGLRFLLHVPSLFWELLRLWLVLVVLAGVLFLASTRLMLVLAGLVLLIRAFGLVGFLVAGLLILILIAVVGGVLLPGLLIRRLLLVRVCLILSILIIVVIPLVLVLAWLLIGRVLSVFISLLFRRIA